MEAGAKVVAEIVTDALGERPTRVEHVPTLEDSTVYRVRVPSGEVFFKNEHEGHSIAMSAWAYGTAKGVGVPVPDVLHLDTSKTRWPQDFIIITGLSGTDLQNDPLEGDALADVLGAAGELLRRLHTVSLDGFCDIEGDPPRGVLDDHASCVRLRNDWSLPYAIEHGLIDETTLGAYLEIVRRHEELAPAPSRGSLIHGDLGLDHIFVDRSTMTITGIIDFEAENVDPVFDLANFRFHYPDLFGHLLHGYGPTPDDLEVRLDLYAMLKAVGSLRWEHERGFDSYLRHAQDELARRTKLLLEQLHQ